MVSHSIRSPIPLRSKLHPSYYRKGNQILSWIENIPWTESDDAFILINTFFRYSLQRNLKSLFAFSLWRNVKIRGVFFFCLPISMVRSEVLGICKTECLLISLETFIGLAYDEIISFQGFSYWFLNIRVFGHGLFL